MFRSIKSLASAAVVVGLLVGCTTSELGRVGEGPREAINYAARAKYPGNPQKSDRVQVTAVNDDKGHELVLYNLTDRSVPSSTVWVNGAFLTKIDSIAPKGSVTVKHADLLEAAPGTGDMKRFDQPVARVELQTFEGLFTVGGPAQK